MVNARPFGWMGKRSLDLAVTKGCYFLLHYKCDSVSLCITAVLTEHCLFMAFSKTSALFRVTVEFMNVQCS